MKEIIEIKRKEFEVIEQIGNRSFKVERKGKIYFLKKFEGDKKGFEEVIKNQELLRNSGISIPKIYLWDKNSMIFVCDFIDGKDCFSILCERDFEDQIYQCIFTQVYMCKKSKRSIDFNPKNFLFDGEKLFYVAYKIGEYDFRKDFIEKDFPYWFFTKQFVSYAHSLRASVNEDRLLGDGETNKKMALIAIKFYR